MIGTSKKTGITFAILLAIGFLQTMLDAGDFLAAAQAQSAPVRTEADAERMAAFITALEVKLKKMEDRLQYLEGKIGEKSDAALVATTGAVPAAAIERAAAAAPPLLSASAPPQAAAQAAPPPAVLVGAGADGFNLRSANGDFRLNIRYQMNVDSRFAADRTTGEPNSIFLRRAQPILGGTVFRRFDFYILTDFGQGRARVNDAYFEIAFADGLRLRAGKSKIPVGLERLRGGTSLTIAERSIATQLVPNRDVGLQLYGDIAGGRLSYAAGVFNGVADAATGDGDADDGKEFAARIFSHPFAGSDISSFEGLGLGIGMSRGDTESLPSYSTTGQTTFFEYADNAAADGTRYRIAPQAYYYNGRLGLLGEYVLSSQDVTNSATSVLYSPKNTGWHLQGSFLLTGDTASYAAVSPVRNFDPANGSFGAFELAARFAELRVDRGLYEQGIGGGIAQKAKAWALGLNWYMNRSVRMMFDYEQTDFVERPGFTHIPTERVFLQRFQLKL